METIVPLSDALSQEAREGAFKDLLATLEKSKKDMTKKTKVSLIEKDCNPLPAVTATAATAVKSSRASRRREELTRSIRAHEQAPSPPPVHDSSASSPPPSPSSPSTSSRSSSFSSSSPPSPSSSNDDGSDGDHDSNSSTGLAICSSSQMSSNPTDALDDSCRIERGSLAGRNPDPLPQLSNSTLHVTAQTQTETGQRSETHPETQLRAHPYAEPMVEIGIDRNVERIIRREMDLEASKEKEKDMEIKIATLCKELEIERLRSKEAVTEVRSPALLPFQYSINAKALLQNLRVLYPSIATFDPFSSFRP